MYTYTPSPGRLRRAQLGGDGPDGDVPVSHPTLTERHQDRSVSA